jgi:aminopeptidase N
MLAEAAVDAIRSQRDPAYLEVLLNVLSEREGDLTTSGFSSGLHALAVLAADEEDKTAYREFLLRHVNHLKRGVQLAAIRALGTLGDPQSIAVLATFAAGSQESPRTQAAEEAIRRLREGRPQAAEVSTLRNEVMALQKQNRELKQQFEETVKRIEAARPTAEAAAPTPERRRGWFDRSRD